MKLSFVTLYCHHLCGGLLRVCNTCNRQFCEKCEGNLCTAYHKNLNPCCRKAIVEYWTERDEEIIGKMKTQTVIEEISDGKL